MCKLPEVINFWIILPKKRERERNGGWGWRSYQSNVNRALGSHMEDGENKIICYKNNSCPRWAQEDISDGKKKNLHYIHLFPTNLMLWGPAVDLVAKIRSPLWLSQGKGMMLWHSVATDQKRSTVRQKVQTTCRGDADFMHHACDNPTKMDLHLGNQHY